MAGRAGLKCAIYTVLLQEHTHTHLPSFCFTSEFSKVTPKWGSKSKESRSSTGLGCRSEL